MSDKWVPKKKRISFLKIIILVLIMCGVILLFFMNNTNLFSSKSDTAVSKPDDRKIYKAGNEKLPAEERNRYDKGKKKESDSSNQTVNTGDIEKNSYSLKISNIKCGLSGRKGIKLNVSVELFFKEISFREKLRTQSEGIRVLINKKVSAKNMSEIEIENLRKEILREINSFIDGGKIDDIEFLDFSPVN